MEKYLWRPEELLWRKNSEFDIGAVFFLKKKRFLTSKTFWHALSNVTKETRPKTGFDVMVKYPRS